jgi:hypothetical protein
LLIGSTNEVFVIFGLVSGNEARRQDDRPQICVESAFHAQGQFSRTSVTHKAAFSRFDPNHFVDDVYNTIENNLKVVRGRLNRPLALPEKILYGHLDDAQNQETFLFIHSM